MMIGEGWGEPEFDLRKIFDGFFFPACVLLVDRTAFRGTGCAVLNYSILLAVLHELRSRCLVI